MCCEPGWNNTLPSAKRADCPVPGIGNLEAPQRSVMGLADWTRCVHLIG
jgi:hypothetical protein